MSYWAAFGIGVGVGIAAALVRRAMAFPPFRPPRGWITDTIRAALIFLPGVVVGAFTGSFFSGVLVWLGSLVGGVVSLLFPEYVPEDLRVRRAAQEALHKAQVYDDKEEVLGFVDSPYAGLRSYAVSIIRRREWREFTGNLVRRLDVETDPDVRSSLSLALGKWAAPATRETLAMLLNDRDEAVRRQALMGLSRIGDSRVPAAAKAMYETGGYFARTQAVWSLLALGTPEADATLHGLIANQSSLIRRRQARAVIRRFRKDVARGKPI